MKCIDKDVVEQAAKTRSEILTLAEKLDKLKYYEDSGKVLKVHEILYEITKIDLPKPKSEPERRQSRSFR